ncbi:MAG: tetratricopeptide repeat protein [Planctomycetota bacterium]|nr:tetratricopeptide repeat protein [Planctomycetota bacterium]
MSTKVEKYDEAIALKSDGKDDEALAKLESLLKDEPDYALVHSALSVYYGKLDRLDEAVEHAQKVCELEPNDPFSFVAMSMACQKAGKLSEAEDAMAQARQVEFAAQQAAQQAQKDAEGE